MNTKFERLGNSHAACFQYKEAPGPYSLYRSIKVYNVVLARLLSDGPMKSLGMNTQALFAPKSRMVNAIVSTLDEGLTRLEISYYADSQEAERKFFGDGFKIRCEFDLDRVLSALNQVKDLCYRVPLLDLLKTFQIMA